jgi:hypothetical protein
MRGSRVLLGLAGAMALAPFAVVAQQLPMYGCRTALSCRPGPVSVSSLNDPASSSLLFGARLSWGPGVHFGFVTPLLVSPASEPTPAVDAQVFHLRGVSLWPPPTPTPAPAPPATSPAPGDPARDEAAPKH